MSDDILDPTPAKEDAPVERVLPDHLKPEWFADGVEPPAFLLNHPDWMGEYGAVLNPAISVEMPDGSRANSDIPAHIAQWLLANGAKIIHSERLLISQER